jgi:hypothetical protein
MTTLEREFYRSKRGPAPSDEDIWRLAFDRGRRRLLVRHEWRPTRHSGIREFTVDEFLAQGGAALEASARTSIRRSPVILA